LAGRSRAATRRWACWSAISTWCGPGDELTDPAIGQSISDHIVDLAALALGARGDYAELARQRGAKAARLAAIRSDILRTLGRSDLSTELIAARHGISPRYVRKLFEETARRFPLSSSPSASRAPTAC
jgi:hypothetical protein